MRGLQFLVPLALFGAALAAHAGGTGEHGGPTRSTRSFVLRYLAGLRAAPALQATQRFRLREGKAWQLVHDVVNHSPPVLRRREFAHLKRCAAGPLNSVEPLVSADRERRVRVRVHGTEGRPGCTGTLGLVWEKGRWWIVTERWREERPPPPAVRQPQTNTPIRG